VFCPYDVRSRWERSGDLLFPRLAVPCLRSFLATPASEALEREVSGSGSIFFLFFFSRRFDDQDHMNRGLPLRASRCGVASLCFFQVQGGSLRRPPIDRRAPRRRGVVPRSRRSGASDDPLPARDDAVPPSVRQARRGRPRRIILTTAHRVMPPNPRFSSDHAASQWLHLPYLQPRTETAANLSDASAPLENRVSPRGLGASCNGATHRHRACDHGSTASEYRRDCQRDGCPRASYALPWTPE